jgi:hypothetical protein
MVSTPSVPDFAQQLQKTSYGQLLAEPKLQPLINELKSKVQEAFQQEVQADLGVSLNDLLALPQGELTFAILEKPARKLSAVLMFESGQNEATLETLLKKLDGALVREGAEHSTQELGDVQVHVYKLPIDARNNPFNSLLYFRDKGYVVFGSDLAALKAVQELRSGSSADCLAKADVYAYIQQKCQSSNEAPVMTWYLDLVGLVKAALNLGNNPQQAAIAAAMMPILGFDKLKGMGGCAMLDVDQFDGVSKSFIYAEQPPAGVLGALQFPAADLQPPAWVSADVASYFSLNWDADGAYLAVESLIDSLQGPGATAKVLESFANPDEGPGVHLKKDVIDLLTGRIDVVMQPPRLRGDEPPVPEFAVSVGLKDAAKMKRTIAKAVESDDFPGSARQIDGQTVYELPVQGGMQMSFAVGGDALVLAASAELIDRILKGQSRSALAQSKEFSRFAKEIPKRVSIVSFQRSDSQVDALLDMLQKEGANLLDGFDASRLPDAEVIKKYMRPTCTYIVPDKKGALMVGFSLKAE